MSRNNFSIAIKLCSLLQVSCFTFFSYFTESIKSETRKSLRIRNSINKIRIALLRCTSSWFHFFILVESICILFVYNAVQIYISISFQLVSLILELDIYLEFSISLGRKTVMSEIVLFIVWLSVKKNSYWTGCCFRIWINFGKSDYLIGLYIYYISSEVPLVNFEPILRKKNSRKMENSQTFSFRKSDTKLQAHSQHFRRFRSLSNIKNNGEF